MPPFKNKRLILAFFLLLLVAFVVSLIGLWRLSHPATPGEWHLSDSPADEPLHQTIRFFVPGGSDLRDLSGTNLFVYVGRLLALITVLWATTTVAFLVLRRTIREFRLETRISFLAVRPSAVLFGLDSKHHDLIPELSGSHERSPAGWSTRPVVVILPDRSSSFARACERAGLWIVEATPLDERLEFISGFHRSPETFIFGDDSAANIELAIKLQEISEPKQAAQGEKLPDNHPVIHVQTEDPDVRFALANQVVGRKTGRTPDRNGSPPVYFYPTTIVPFSIPVIAARQVLGGGRLARLPDQTANDSRALNGSTTFLLFGCRRWLRAFLAETIKNSVIDLSKKPVIHVFCPDADGLEERLKAEIPEWNQLHVHGSIHFHKPRDPQPESNLIMAREVIGKFGQCEDPTAPWNFICLLPDDGNNLSLASRLTTELAAPETDTRLRPISRVLFLSRETTELGRSLCQAIEGGPMVEAIGQLSDTASLDAIRQQDLIRLAIRIDDGYRGKTAEHDHLAFRSRDLPTLQGLSLIKREQNFTQASHIDVKLDHLGLPPATLAEPDEVAAEINRLFAAGQTPDPAWRTGQGEKPGKAVDEILSDKKDDGNPVAVTEDTEFDLSLFHRTIRELAELEHLRWMQVHILAGFRPSTKRVDSLRLHDCLYGFDDEPFPKKTIPYDIEAIRLLPDLVQIIRDAEPEN